MTAPRTTESTPDDGPRAPSAAAWQAMTPREREAVRERLGPIPAGLHPPSGDPHINAERAAEDALEHWFKAIRRRAYIGRGLAVYYPDEPRFEPDLFVVFDVEPGERVSWVCSHEGRGLDFVLEIHFRGDRHKDLSTNVARYARLGIGEYFVFDVGRGHLQGWRLEPGHTTYTPIIPQGGAWPSAQLGVSLVLRDRQLRFLAGDIVIPLGRELNLELRRALETAEAARADADARAAAEAEARALAEAEVARLRAENERLRAGAEPAGGRGDPEGAGG